MNIFAKLVVTTNKNICLKLQDNLGVVKKDENENYEIFIKLDDEANIILLYLKDNFELGINFVCENFEVIKIITIGNSLALNSLDIIPGDIILPNAIINKNDEVVFIEEIAEKSYDLKDFGIIMNGICLTLDKKIVDEEELFEYKEDYVADIIDFDTFNILSLLKNKGLNDKIIVIKIVGENDEFIKNGMEVFDMFF